MIDFKNKKILITGASGGIGGALVKKFASLNGNVLGTGTKTEKLDLIKKNHEKNEIVVYSHAGQQESQRAFFRFFAPPGARGAFSRRRPPFEHFHSVFLSIRHVASQKRARAKREKSVPSQSFFS